MDFKKINASLIPLADAYGRFTESFYRQLDVYRSGHVLPKSIPVGEKAHFVSCQSEPETDVYTSSRLALLKAQKECLDLQAQQAKSEATKAHLLAQSSLTSLQIERIEGLQGSSI